MQHNRYIFFSNTPSLFTVLNVFFFKYPVCCVISMSTTAHGVFCTVKRDFGNPNGVDDQKYHFHYLFA